VERVKAEGSDGSISFTCQTDPVSQRQCLAVQALLNSVGFKTSIVNTASISEFLDKIYVKYDFELTLSGLSISDSEAWLQLSIEYFPYGPGGFDNPAMNAALDKVRAAATHEETVAALDQVQKVYNEQNPEVTYAYSPYAYVDEMQSRPGERASRPARWIASGQRQDQDKPRRRPWTLNRSIWSVALRTTLSASSTALPSTVRSSSSRC
jgi:hypothetical protein